jgi:hypothetical protein
LEPVSLNVKKEDVEIAIISYGYYNQNMIKLLQNRGKLIAMGKINEFVKNENDSKGLVLRNSDFNKMK